MLLDELFSKLFKVPGIFSNSYDKKIYKQKIKVLY